MKLDYTIKTLNERIQYVNKIIEENHESIQKYFDNVFLTDKEKLPFNYLLHQLTNYLLYLNNQPTYKQKKQFKFEKDVENIDDERFGSKIGYYDQNTKITDDDFEISDFRSLLNIDFMQSENWKYALKFLRFQNEIGEKVNRISRIFNECSKKCSFTDIEDRIIQIYLKKQSKKAEKEFIIIKNIDISKKLNIDQVEVSRFINSICKKLSKAYEEIFTEYYYTYLAKGKYKKCSTCGFTKLIGEFHKNKNTKDGYQNICKECLKNSHKICSKCGQDLNIKMFSKHPNTKDGLQSICKYCNLKYKNEKFNE